MDLDSKLVRSAVGLDCDVAQEATIPVFGFLDGAAGDFGFLFLYFFFFLLWFAHVFKT